MSGGWFKQFYFHFEREQEHSLSPFAADRITTVRGAMNTKA